jgi:DNA-binding response OmpR family regulator
VKESIDMAPIVLVVDDETHITALATEILSEAGCCAIPAKDGKHALEILQDFRVDVLLTDMRMPRPDCWDLLEAVRGTSAPPAAIVMTACITDLLHQEAKLRGAAVLHKPFARTELVAAVTEAAQVNRDRRDAVHVATI